jgi:predicted dehydrogenase
MEKAKIGVIGLGLIGKPHSENLKKIGECDLVAVADADAKQRKLAETLGTKFYLDYQEMIEKETLDGVVIAVPNDLHVPVGIACAKRKIHLLVEKPIAPSLAEADRLIAAAKENHVRILVGHQRRFNLKQHGASSEGELELVGVTLVWALYKPSDYFEGPFTWRKSKGGGPILINLIHEIDNLRYICGEVVRVYAEASHRVRNFPVEDSSCATLVFENGALGSIFLSDCVPSLSGYEATTGENPLMYHDSGNCYQFYGTKASLSFPQFKKLFYSDPARTGWHHPLSEEDVRWFERSLYEGPHISPGRVGKEEPRTRARMGEKHLKSR